MNGGDPDFAHRLIPARPDLAAAYLRGKITAGRYAEATRMEVCEALAPLRFEPRADARLATELLFGERFDVYDVAAGWAWGQAVLDSYVGYVSADRLRPARQDEPTHVMCVPRSFVYPAPDIKSPPLHALGLESRLHIRGTDEKFACLAEGGYVISRHIAPVDVFDPDYARTALRFLDVPYLWGGRSAAGLDCSALVQLALARAGIKAPRDSDQQEMSLGIAVGRDELARGDLVFWPGHVGIMLDGTCLVHASAYHMTVIAEPLVHAEARIAATVGPVRVFKRLGD